MYEYPNKVDLRNLEQVNPEYRILHNVWGIIDDLIVGGHQLEAKKGLYIMPRPDENPKLYALRLRKFVYTPVLGDAIKDFTTKLTKAPMYVTGCDGKLWDDFRQRTDGKRRKEKVLVSALFRDLIAYGRCFAFIDKPINKVDGVKTRLEEERLGLKPYVTVFKPNEVINWQWGNDGELDFIKVRQIHIENNPLGETKYVAKWTLIDREVIAVYKADISIAFDGSIALINTADSQVPLYSLINHGRGSNPVVAYILDDELWTGNAAYLKALQYLQVENTFTDTATIAGYIQRIFKPMDRKPDNDINSTYVDDDAGLEEIKSSNAHLLIGNSFEFAEAKGTSLQVLSEYVLDKIERQIKAIVSMGNVGVDATDVKQQSGISKSLDFAQLETTMQKYGEILCEIYTEILKKVAAAFGFPVERISVEGLNNFDNDVIGELLKQSEIVSKIEDRMPDKARRIWWLRVINGLLSDVDSQTKDEIKTEMDNFTLPSVSSSTVPVFPD